MKFLNKNHRDRQKSSNARNKSHSISCVLHKDLRNLPATVTGRCALGGGEGGSRVHSVHSVHTLVHIAQTYKIIPPFAAYYRL